MPLVLEANYSKKLGLPGYSSHQYSVTLRTELTDLNQVGAENTRLYGLLQSCVDQEIQKTGFLPQAAPRNGSGNGPPDHWACSPKQKDLILDLIEQHKLDKNAIEQLAQDRFGKGVKQLNRLEASGLLDELLARHGGTNGNGRANASVRPAPAGGPR